MDAVILSRQHFNAIVEKLDHIKTNLKKDDFSEKHFIDNKTFNRLMGISPRTSQLWREDRKIGYSQVGSKIYYQKSDIEKFFADHHQGPLGSPNVLIQSA